MKNKLIEFPKELGVPRTLRNSKSCSLKSFKGRSGPRLNVAAVGDLGRGGAIEVGVGTGAFGLPGGSTLGESSRSPRTCARKWPPPEKFFSAVLLLACSGDGDSLPLKKSAMVGHQRLFGCAAKPRSILTCPVGLLEHVWSIPVYSKGQDYLQRQIRSSYST